MQKCYWWSEQPTLPLEMLLATSGVWRLEMQFIGHWNMKLPLEMLFIGHWNMKFPLDMLLATEWIVDCQMHASGVYFGVYSGVKFTWPLDMLLATGTFWPLDMLLATGT